MELLRQQLIAYRPWNEQEERDREELLRRLDSHEDLYTRANTAAHFTASAWVVSPDRKQVLMAYHRLYDSWAWLGGHADGDRDLLAVALREVREESGPGLQPVDVFEHLVFAEVPFGPFSGGHRHGGPPRVRGLVFSGNPDGGRP